MSKNREAVKPASSDVPLSVHNVLRDAGRPLDRATRARMESRFGYDFSHVRVHTGSRAQESARDAGALAWTAGRDVAFATDRYRPGTPSGDSLIAHELTHVVQQRDAAGPLRLGTPHDPAEAEADRGIASTRLSQPTLQRQTPSGEDREHSGMLKHFRDDYDLPSGEKGGPSDAQIKYQLLQPKEDLSRIRIVPVADFLVKDLTAPQPVGVWVKDPSVKSIEWELSGPDGKVLPDAIATRPGDTDATTKRFQLKPSQFTKAAGFKPGRHLLTCRGLDDKGLITVRAVRDFNVLESDLETNKPAQGTYGKLTFTEYSKTDAPSPGGLYHVVAKLDFLPKDTVDCTDIAYMQAIQVLDSTGKSLLPYLGSGATERSTPMAWTIDQGEDQRSPYYITQIDPATHEMKDDPTFYGKSGRGGKTPDDAKMRDTPKGNTTATYHYESCAVCRSGGKIGSVFSCATWGFRANSEGKVTLMPRSVADGPSWIMRASGESWNKWNKNKPATPARLTVPELR